jgi:hypothetical protein
MLVNRDVHARQTLPTRNLATVVKQRMPRVFKVDRGRPCQPVLSGVYSLKYSKYGSRFAGNPLLTLIVKGPVETIQVEV